MTEQKEQTEESVVEHIAITPAFESALHFALMTRRGAMLKPFQQRLDELTDQDIVNIIEALAVMLDQLGKKEAECNLLREAIEMTEESFENFDTTIDQLRQHLTEGREGVREQIAWADERRQES